jgi:hypothetical protein
VLAVGRLAAELARRGEHFAHHLLLGGRLELDVEEAGAGDVDGIDPLLEGRRRQQVFAQRLGHLPRVLLQGLGQLHRGGAGQIAMGGGLGRFEHRLVGGARRQVF